MRIADLFKDTNVVVNTTQKFPSFFGFEVQKNKCKFYIMLEKSGKVSIDLNSYNLDDVSEWKWAQRIKTTDIMKQQIYSFDTLADANEFLMQL